MEIINIKINGKEDISYLIDDDESAHSMFGIDWAILLRNTSWRSIFLR